MDGIIDMEGEIFWNMREETTALDGNTSGLGPYVSLLIGIASPHVTPRKVYVDICNPAYTLGILSSSPGVLDLMTMLMQREIRGDASSSIADRDI